GEVEALTVRGDLRDAAVPVRPAAGLVAVDALADRVEVAVDRQEGGVVPSLRVRAARRGGGEGEQRQPRAGALQRLGEGDRRALEVVDGVGVGDGAGQV